MVNKYLELKGSINDLYTLDEELMQEGYVEKEMLNELLFESIDTILEALLIAGDITCIK